IAGLQLILIHVAVLLATAVLAVIMSGRREATSTVYGITLVSSVLAMSGIVFHLLATPTGSTALVLPLGLPWLGTHFRLDALSGFFLIVVNLGSAAASLYGLGYGAHEKT